MRAVWLGEVVVSKCVGCLVSIIKDKKMIDSDNVQPHDHPKPEDGEKVALSHLDEEGVAGRSMGSWISLGHIPEQLDSVPHVYSSRVPSSHHASRRYLPRRRFRRRSCSRFHCCPQWPGQDWRHRARVEFRSSLAGDAYDTVTLAIVVVVVVVGGGMRLTKNGLGQADVLAKLCGQDKRTHVSMCALDLVVLFHTR